MLPLKHNYYENPQNSLLEPISPSLEMTLDKMMDEFPFLYNIMEGMLVTLVYKKSFSIKRLYISLAFELSSSSMEDDFDADYPISSQ